MGKDIGTGPESPTKQGYLSALCAPAALDHPSDAHRLAPPREGVNDDFVNIRYAFLTCHLRCLNRPRGRREAIPGVISPVDPSAGRTIDLYLAEDAA